MKSVHNKLNKEYNESNIVTEESQAVSFCLLLVFNTFLQGGQSRHQRQVGRCPRPQTFEWQNMPRVAVFWAAG